MKIDIEAYKNNYHQGEKFIDNWQKGVKLLPFDSRNASAYDKKCGLQGITGEFFRLWDNDGTKPIENFEESALDPVADYLYNQKQMPQEQVTEFREMMKDIMFIDGNLNITDSSFLKFLPLIPSDERITEKEKNKYIDGQRKLSNYIFSMLPDDKNYNKGNHPPKNLFSRILQEALVNDVNISDEVKKHEYTILPYIKDSFVKDISWILEQEESVKVKYIHLLIHFYICYAVTQALVAINQKTYKPEPYPFYFILSSEKVSITHDAVVRGWSHYFPISTLDKVYGKSQALDILNSVLGGEIGFYNDVYEKLEETPFDENREACNELLNSYQEEKRYALEHRSSERQVLEKFEKIDIDVQSYKEFVCILERLCVGLQSPSYIRMKKKVIDLLSVRFLQNRTRSGYVLSLDNEMLTFLIALFTKGEKTKLEKLYKIFNSYGIFFNRGSRLAIEDYLLKLNLLDRKSDSGEAQYVKVVL